TLGGALSHLGDERFDRFRRMPVRQDAFLVLDDAHVLTTTVGRNSLADLVALLPPWLHLVVVGREQPALSLWRLRASGHVSEIGDDDLRMTVDEAKDLAGDGNERPSAADVVGLHERTDGWIAGLQLMIAG